MTAKSKRAAELEEKRRKIKQKCDELFAAALAKLASAEHPVAAKLSRESESDSESLSLGVS